MTIAGARIGKALLAAVAALAWGLPAHGQQPQSRLVREAASFDRAGFTEPSAAEEVQAAGNLRGTHCCVSGWAEYDFTIQIAGWYQLWVTGGALEYLVDPPGSVEGEPKDYFAGGSGLPGEPDKVGNLWLETGRHRVRVQTYLWWGFSDLRSIELRRSGDPVDESVSIPWPRAGQIFRMNQCPSFDLLSGGRHSPADLAVISRNRESGAIARRQLLHVPTSAGLERLHFQVACGSEGFFRVSVAEVVGDRERDIDSRGIKGFDYEVVDTRELPTERLLPSEERVLAIDCAQQVPDYASGESSIVHTAAGSYRESGDLGWMGFLRRPEAERKGPQDPSWFAYALPDLTPGNRYRIEIDYPDDKDRTFGIMLREAYQHAYPVSIGVDTGGPYAVSDAMQTTGMTVWVRSTGPRLLFVPAFDGGRAACSRIRVARLTPAEPARAAAHREGTREFVYWYEEGLNFIDLFGATSGEPEQLAKAIDRWAGSAVEQGGTTLMPTVLVYGGQLYPSRYNLMEMFPDKDPLRRIVLSAERYHLRVIPELHPRSDELMYGKNEASARKLLLISKDGRDNYFAGDSDRRSRPPFYNVLLPEVQDWLIAMIGELADRYRDSRAVEGISLRFMQWSNAALDNLVNLNWGYNDEIVRRFETETRTPLPPIDDRDPQRFGKRYTWLTTTGRSTWIDWRCQQITTLLRQIVHRVQRARPDLKLYVHVFPSDAEVPYRTNPADGVVDTPITRLREAGLDPTQIARIPGVVLVDSSLTYGRDRPTAVEKGLLQTLRDPELLTALRIDGNAHYISTHRYIEATEEVVPPALLGFPKSTRSTGASVAANRPERAALERFAIELAAGDALMLGDGGNGYVYSVPGLQEFLRDYTQLPAETLDNASATNVPMTVRTLMKSGTWWIYVVNREAATRCMELEIDGTESLKRVSDGAELASADHRYRLTLPEFGVLVAYAKGSHRVNRMSPLPRCSSSRE